MGMLKRSRTQSKYGRITRRRATSTAAKGSSMSNTSGFEQQCAPQRDPLTLPTRQGCWTAPQQITELQRFDHFR